MRSVAFRKRLNEIDECEVETEFKNKYGIIITNETKRNLNYIMEKIGR